MTRRAWIALLAFWAAITVSQLFYYHPPVWPDEGTSGDVAYSLATGRGFAAPSLAGQVPGAERYLAWHPPLHTVAVAALFRVTGPRVEAMRALSLAAAFVLLVALWRLAARMAGPLAAMIAITLLLVDARFLRGAILGRNDGLAMAFAFLALWRGAGVWAGVLAGLALSTHPAGAIVIGAIGLQLLFSRAGLRAITRFALGVAAGLVPWALQIALEPSLFIEQFALQMHRNSTGWWATIAQITWNLDSRPPIALLIWTTYVAGAVWVARRLPDPDARRLLLLALGGLALNLARPEVTYVLWLTVPAALGLAGWAAAPPPAGRRAIARMIVIALIAVHATYVSALAVRARGLDYPMFAASMRRCIADAAAPGTRVLINSVPDVYLSMIHRRDIVGLRQTSPPSDDANRRATLREIDAILFGPIVAHPGWTVDVAAEPGAWTLTPLREAGGYRATLAVRNGVHFPIPPDCR